MDSYPGKNYWLVLLICCCKLIQGNVEVLKDGLNETGDKNGTTITNLDVTPTVLEDGILVDTENLTFCSCDLSKRFCDINCCCDPDCTTDDKNEFSECKNVVFYVGDENLCERVTVSLNGTNTREKSKSAFCIWKDNYEVRHVLPDVKAASTLEEFDKLVSRVAYLTESMQLKNVKDESRQNNLFSQFIFVKSSFKSVLGFPYPVVGNICNGYLPLQFAQNEEIECLQVLQSLNTDCERNDALNASNYYKEVNITNELAILPELCSADSVKCSTEQDVPEPHYNNEENLCKDVVSSVEYIIKHNDKEILSITARVTLQDVASESLRKPTLLKQKFKAVFRWANDKAATVSLSGNPGYVVGYPVLAITTKGKWNINDDGWLTVPLPAAGGECVDSIRTPILFGENMVSSCTINISGATQYEVCSKLGQILEMVFNSTSSHVGAYGNSSRNKTGDWVPILCPDNADCIAIKEVVAENDKCAGVFRLFHIELMYVYVGFADNRQAKIIGAVLRAKSEFVNLVPSTHSSRWALSTCVTVSVAFVDVTVPPVSVFAPFPTFDIRLPHNFFYPFV